MRRGTDLVLWIPVARSSPLTGLDDLNASQDASVLPGRQGSRNVLKREFTLQVPQAGSGKLAVNFARDCN